MALLGASRVAFVGAMAQSVLIGAAVAVAGALVFLVWLPSRATGESADGATPLEGPARASDAPARDSAA